MGCGTRSDKLRRGINERIQTLLQEHMDLPPEYTRETYARSREIQDALNGLYDIKRRFLSPPPHDKPSACDEEPLY